MFRDILLPNVKLKQSGAYYESGLKKKTEAITANATYFGNPQWAREYLDFCHRDAHFRSRWLAAAGDWTDKIVIDLGCGPGNIFATVGGKPRSRMPSPQAASSSNTGTNRTSGAKRRIRFHPGRYGRRG